MRRLSIAVTLTILAAGCDEPPSPTTPDVPPALSVTACDPNLQPAPVEFFSAEFLCGETVSVSVSGGNSTEVAGVWTAANGLNLDPDLGLPRWVQSGGTHTVTVQIFNHYTAGTPHYCASSPSGTIRIYRLNAGMDCPEGEPDGAGLNPVETPDFIGVAAHELTHAFGWGPGHMNGDEPQFNPCVTNIESDGTIHHRYCDLEAQLMFYAYRLRDTKPTLEQPLSNHVDVLLNSGSTEMAPGETRTVSAVVTGCDGTPLSGPAASASTGCNETVVWSVSDPSVLELISSTGTSATVRARNVSSTRSAFVHATLPERPTTIWPEAVGSMLLTVKIPVVPPPPPPSVKTVTIEPDPVVTIPGGTTVEAIGRDRFGNVVPNVAFTWSTANPNVAVTSGPGTGHVCGITRGTTTVRATAPNGAYGEATVEVPIGGTGCW